MTLYALGTDSPTVDETAWVAPDANLIGKVVLEAGASVWFGSRRRRIECAGKLRISHRHGISSGDR